jgi:hypothetical protein
MTWASDDEAVLMNWLTTEENYTRYVGGKGNQGETKTRINKEILLLIQKDNPSSQRNAHDVGTKIAAFELEFRRGKDWHANTGEGLRLDDKEHEIEVYVAKRFPHYNELYPVMNPRPNSVVTTP